MLSERHGHWTTHRSACASQTRSAVSGTGSLRVSPVPRIRHPRPGRSPECTTDNPLPRCGCGRDRGRRHFLTVGGSPGRQRGIRTAVSTARIIGCPVRSPPVPTTSRPSIVAAVGSTDPSSGGDRFRGTPLFPVGVPVSTSMVPRSHRHPATVTLIPVYRHDKHPQWVTAFVVHIPQMGVS